MTDKIPTDAQQYLNVASQCAATATSELAKNVLVDDGSGTLRELLNDAADAIRAGWGQPVQAAEPVAREPLTPERVKEIVRGAGYDQCGIPDTERAAFINGLRHGEREHGIKGGRHG